MNEGWKRKLEHNLIPKLQKELDSLELRLSATYDYNNAILAVRAPRELTDAERAAVSSCLQSGTDIGFTIEGPTTYRFMMHLQPSQLPIWKPSWEGKLPSWSCSVSDLRQVRDAYHSLEGFAADVDHVATFALGGLAALLWLVDRQGYPHPDDAEQFVERMNSKYHLFGGLSWEGGAGKKATRMFVDWLSTIEPGRRVVLFDTTRKGNATNCLFRVLQEAQRLGRIQTGVQLKVVALAERTVPEVRRATRLSLHGRSGNANATVDWLFVDNIVTEDRERLIGYQSLRKVFSLQSVWACGIVYVTGRDGRVVQVLGTSNAAVDIDTLIDASPTLDPNGPSVTQLSHNFANFAIVSRALVNEEIYLSRARDRGVITTDEWETESRKLRRRVAKLRKGFYATLGDRS